MSGLHCGFLVPLLLFLSQSPSSTQAVCEPLKKSFCRGQGYNATIFPNRFGHRSQRQALGELQVYSPLVNVQCSDDLPFFLCSIYMPMCTILHKVIPPCRSLCLSAKSGCETILNKFGFLWPKQLDCHLFPKIGSNQTCVFQNKSSIQTGQQTPITHITPLNEVGTIGMKAFTLKQRQKFCWQSRRGRNKRCCRQGNKAAKMGLNECSLGKRPKKKWSRRKKGLFKKANKVCSSLSSNKMCYQSCCEFKKRQLKPKKKQTRKSRRRPD